MLNFTAKLSDPGSWSYDLKIKNNMKMPVEIVLLKVLRNIVPECQCYHISANPSIFSMLPGKHSVYFLSLGLEFVKITVCFIIS